MARQEDSRVRPPRVSLKLSLYCDEDAKDLLLLAGVIARAVIKYGCKKA